MKAYRWRSWKRSRWECPASLLIVLMAYGPFSTTDVWAIWCHRTTFKRLRMLYAPTFSILDHSTPRLRAAQSTFAHSMQVSWRTNGQQPLRR